MVGLVTKVGQGSLQDYCMFIYWKDIRNILKRLQNNTLNPFLGIATKIHEKPAGSFVVRIASDSPVGRYLHLGDIITKVNGENVQNPLDLQRLIAFSDKQVSITTTYEGKERTFNV
jgi:S1-C subfamily serine protease